LRNVGGNIGVEKLYLLRQFSLERFDLFIRTIDVADQLHVLLPDNSIITLDVADLLTDGCFLKVFEKLNFFDKLNIPAFEILFLLHFCVKLFDELHDILGKPVMLDADIVHEVENRVAARLIVLEVDPILLVWLNEPLPYKVLLVKLHFVGDHV
jgi:hypothetical protein